MGDGNIKLADFGSAFWCDTPQDSIIDSSFDCDVMSGEPYSSDSARKGIPQDINCGVGTPYFMAPEVLVGERSINSQMQFFTLCLYEVDAYVVGALIRVIFGP